MAVKALYFPMFFIAALYMEHYLTATFGYFAMVLLCIEFHTM